MRFSEKTCLVTGGGSGIGRASCERFAREGGKVAVAPKAFVETKRRRLRDFVAEDF